jgi:hypothetical protein
MRAVIDTNRLLNSIPRNAAKRWLYESFKAGKRGLSGLGRPAPAGVPNLAISTGARHFL